MSRTKQAPRLKPKPHRPKKSNTRHIAEKAAAAAFLFWNGSLGRAPGARYNISMSVLRRAVTAIPMLACLLAAAVAAADASGDLAATRGLAQAGAVHLALRRIDVLQPPDTTASSWAEWEHLRLEMLMRLGRHEELLRRAGLLSPAVSPDRRAQLHVIAARAGLALGRNAVARDHAARALWTPGLDDHGLRSLRLLVIRSYVQESRADDAWRSMLRFEQDYRPLDAATVSGFVDALLDLGMAKEAVHWLGLLEERSAAKLRLRLHAGVLSPQEAVTQARTALSRGGDADWWRVLGEVAGRQNDGVLRIATQEQLLELDTGPQPKAADAGAAALWRAYDDHARDAANAHQLLAGDDGNWLAFAVGRRDSAPALARIYFGHLARHARAPALRDEARARLAAEYAAAKLPRVALRMFGALAGDRGALAAPVRRVLGTLAEGIADPVAALRYWQDLPAPEHTTAASWQLRLAALALRAADPDVATEFARQLAAGQPAIPAAQLPEWIVVAQQFADHGLHDAARALFERILPHADAGLSRIVLSGIARSHEAGGEPSLAADFYLRSALRASTPDAAAAEARMLAGLNLARAGLREDARAQFEWLLKNARDPAQIAVARRELGF